MRELHLNEIDRVSGGGALIAAFGPLAASQVGGSSPAAGSTNGRNVTITIQGTITIYSPTVFGTCPPDANNCVGVQN